MRKEQLQVQNQPAQVQNKTATFTAPSKKRSASCVSARRKSADEPPVLVKHALSIREAVVVAKPKNCTYATPTSSAAVLKKAVKSEIATSTLKACSPIEETERVAKLHVDNTGYAVKKEKVDEKLAVEESLPVITTIEPENAVGKIDSSADISNDDNNKGLEDAIKEVAILEPAQPTIVAPEPEVAHFNHKTSVKTRRESLVVAPVAVRRPTFYAERTYESEMHRASKLLRLPTLEHSGEHRRMRKRDSKTFPRAARDIAPIKDQIINDEWTEVILQRRYHQAVTNQRHNSPPGPVGPCISPRIPSPSVTDKCRAAAHSYFATSLARADMFDRACYSPFSTGLDITLEAGTFGQARTVSKVIHPPEPFFNMNYATNTCRSTSAGAQMYTLFGGPATMADGRHSPALPETRRRSWVVNEMNRSVF